MFYSRKQLINLLQHNGLLTSQDVQELCEPQGKSIRQLSAFLIEKKNISKERLSEFVKTHCNIPLVDISQLKINPEAIRCLPAQVARKYSIFPLLKTNLGITLGVSDPEVIFDLEEIKEFKDKQINPVIAPHKELGELIEKNYPLQDESRYPSYTMDDVFGTDFAEITEKVSGTIDISELVQITQEMPVVKATNFVLFKAVELKASDILIEPLENATRIRFRIDGIYHQIELLPRSFHDFIVSRIKVISELDIAEHRFPQDGQFKMSVNDKDVDFRVSVFPTIQGEKAVIRILDSSSANVDINKLGLKEEEVERLKKAALLPFGMILVCGPTGSGKTSTLYSVLKYVHTPEKNIITVEDPVECQVKGINQVPINPKAGLNFSRCLRSILRQDPDVIMIGEIRDFETVDIAIKAALTGHLVLSTLHTTTAAGSIIRLKDMGVEPFLICASLISIVSQRLARRICGHCKERLPSLPYFHGRGCKECMQTGYKGRVLITEILYLTPHIKEVILSKQISENKIKEISRAEGMKTLREAGDDLCRLGITTIDEVLRVTPID
jgi:type IV pilus assembly protein PilB